ncbi:glycosyltransferase [Metabacillus sp. GX 13764]|uniref:glycosyltransferase family 2 protein n=1 Tax=Metabacillus kandeliae TaxID=2900151 RepID=UPI001E6496C1|nr:glycosyltransferase family 2 protein [Metabacillus kandeliae]MCD7034747.1 glycosyltransferase [Metabacillus kandeliae]
MKVSVVVTAYNRRVELAELFEALLRQTKKALEILVVNDAGEEPADLAALYPELPIKIISLNKNSGHVIARNEGIKRAKGNAILLMDDDDLILPEHIERMAKALETADFVYSDAEIVSFKTVGSSRIPQHRRLFAYHDDKLAMRRFSTYVPSGSLYRKEIHEKVGLFDPDMHNYWDWDFILRVSEKYHTKRVPSAGVLYSFSETSSQQSNDTSGKRNEYLKKLCRKHGLGHLPSKNFFLLLEEPELKSREAESAILWDGKPIVSRLASIENPLSI